MADGSVFVYVIASGDYVKIGISNDPKKRLAGLSTGMPEKAFIVGTRECRTRTEARRTEGRLHWTFRECRQQGEWFAAPAASVMAALRKLPRPDSRQEDRELEAILTRSVMV